MLNLQEKAYPLIGALIGYHHPPLATALRLAHDKGAGTCVPAPC